MQLELILILAVIGAHSQVKQIGDQVRISLTQADIEKLIIIKTIAKEIGDDEVNRQLQIVARQYLEYNWTIVFLSFFWKNVR